MRNASAVLGVAALSLILAACVNYSRSVKVADVRKEEVIVLKHVYDSGHVYSIRIRGSGNIDGEATISLILNGEQYKTEKLHGAVSFKWGGDWYSDTAEIRYKPSSVNFGELLIEYQFSTL